MVTFIDKMKLPGPVLSPYARPDEEGDAEFGFVTVDGEEHAIGYVSRADGILTLYSYIADIGLSLDDCRRIKVVK